MNKKAKEDKIHWMFNFSFVSFERKKKFHFFNEKNTSWYFNSFLDKKRTSRESLGRNRLQPIFNKENIINISINSFTQDTRTHSCTKLCFCCPEVFIINFLFPFHHKLFSFILISSTILRSNNLFPIQSCSFLFPLLFSFVVQSIVYLVYNISDLPKTVVNNTKRLFIFLEGNIF